MLCKLCQTRRAKRYCPAVAGEICSICCGRERETTLRCPLDCVYLQEARKHERTADVNPAEFPNPDIRVSETFVRENAALVAAAGRAVLRSGHDTPGAVDSDVAEALAALIRTQRTLASGLYYESRPDNTVAAEIYRRLQTDLADFRRSETEELGMPRTRDADVLAALVFLQRLEIDRRNGRPLGRAFLDFLRVQLPDTQIQTAGSLIV
jgi:hypothetical protein